MDTLLVIGDPLMSAEQLGAPLAQLAGDGLEVRRAQWRIPFEQAVQANLAIEREGPEAVPAALDGDDGDDAAVVAVLTQFFPLTAATLERWPRLRVVATLRAGTENIDRGALEARGIPLVANAGRNANAVAELTVALILSALRAVGENHHSIRSGGWRPERPAHGHHELAGLRIGLIGLGAVGTLVLRRLAGFELDAAYTDPYARAAPPGAVPLDLDALLARSDVLTLHARATPETRGLVGERELALLPEGAVVVNTARAELVDEPALIAALRGGRLAGAGLDVFSVEPLPADHPLRRMPAVTLSPHLAGSTVEARSRAPRLIAERLLATLADA